MLCSLDVKLASNVIPRLLELFFDSPFSIGLHGNVNPLKIFFHRKSFCPSTEQKSCQSPLCYALDSKAVKQLLY